MKNQWHIFKKGKQLIFLIYRIVDRNKEKHNMVQDYRC